MQRALFVLWEMVARYRIYEAFPGVADIVDKKHKIKTAEDPECDRFIELARMLWTSASLPREWRLDSGHRNQPTARRCCSC